MQNSVSNLDYGLSQGLDLSRGLAAHILPKPAQQHAPDLVTELGYTRMMS